MSEYFPSGPKICEWLLDECLIELLMQLTLAFCSTLLVLASLSSCFARTLRKYFNCERNFRKNWTKGFPVKTRRKFAKNDPLPSRRKAQTPLSSLKAARRCKNPKDEQHSDVCRPSSLSRFHPEILPAGRWLGFLRKRIWEVSKLNWFHS